MNASRTGRALARMASGAVLAPDRKRGWFGVFAKGDRRHRAFVRIAAIEVRALEADGAIRKQGDAYVLTDAGRARIARENAEPGEAYVSQHRPVIDRTVIAGNGSLQRLRGHDGDAVLRRLAALRDPSGAPWLAPSELSAAARLRLDWETGQRGLVRGSDWTAPPNAASARAPGNRAELAAGALCDARARVAAALERLAPPLRRVVERICLQETGLEALERSETWPARSGKLALKLALAQLAAQG